MKRHYHTLIVGTGVAGYHAALRLYDLGITDIALITEGVNDGTSRNTGSDKQTYYKLSLCGFEGDSVGEMAGTLFSGGGVMGFHALCEAAYSARCFLYLVELGLPFPRNAYGEYVGYKTDHDPRSRATSLGPLTSKYMTEALQRECAKRQIRVLSPYLVTRIRTDQGDICGLEMLNAKGEMACLACENVILCTGGPAGIYDRVVYPASQHGSLGLAIEAGARLSNADLWQYGIASIGFRWNLSGSYQQVLPTYISVDEAGTEREFLFDALGKDALDLIFLKGYQWPFDSARLDGSGQIDCLVAEQIKAGRRVFLDYTRNPSGLERGFEALGEEAYRYLSSCDALLGTPIERLMKMNPASVELYRSHGIDLSRERLEIAVCAQHCNGGVLVDENWMSDVRGLYVCGEAAGTFGLYRPGGSALNSAMVGSLRAAEHIAAQPKRQVRLPLLEQPDGADVPKRGVDPEAVARELRCEMSRVADFDRDLQGMKQLYERVVGMDLPLSAHGREYALLRDQILTVRAALSAMICRAEHFGSVGGSRVKRMPAKQGTYPKSVRIVTEGTVSHTEPIDPIPQAEYWFESVMNRKGK